MTYSQIENWRRYEAVRVSGKWNMWDEAAMEASGLCRPDYLFSLRNYDKLKLCAAREDIRKERFAAKHPIIRE